MNEIIQIYCYIPYLSEYQTSSSFSNAKIGEKISSYIRVNTVHAYVITWT
jgi:hypothetical protein